MVLSGLTPSFYTLKTFSRINTNTETFTQDFNTEQTNSRVRVEIKNYQGLSFSTLSNDFRSNLSLKDI